MKQIQLIDRAERMLDGDHESDVMAASDDAFNIIVTMEEANKNSNTYC